MKKTGLNGASLDAILLTFIRLVTIVLGLIITRLLSEYLSVYEYGTYSQIMLISSTVASITMFGMMDGVNYFYMGEQDPDKRESYIATIFALQCTMSAVAGCIVMLLNRQLSVYFNNSQIQNYMIYAAVLPFLQNLLGMFRVLFVSIGKARLLAYRNLAISLIKLASVLIVVWVVRSVDVVLITSFVLDIGQILFFWIILRNNGCHIKFHKTRLNMMRHIVGYCAPMAVFLVVNTLNRDLDKFLISAMTDTETLAIYSNASKQLPFDIVMASFCTVLVPYITKYISDKKYAKAIELYKLFLEITYISTGVFCCAALSAGPQLMELLYSNKYTEGLSIFCVYILVDLFRFTNITLVLSAAGRTRKLMMLGIGSLVVNAGLNVVLYNIFGIIGPAIATLVVTILTGWIMLHFSADVLNSKIACFFDFKYLLLFIIESFVLTGALNLLQKFMASLGIHYFVILIVIVSLYCVTMLLLNGKRLLAALKEVNCVGYE